MYSLLASNVKGSNPTNHMLFNIHFNIQNGYKIFSIYCINAALGVCWETSR